VETVETGGDLEFPLFLLLDPLSEAAEAAVDFLFIGCCLVLRLDSETTLISPLFPLVAVDIGGDDGILGVAAEGVDEAVVLEDISPWPLTRSSS